MSRNGRVPALVCAVMLTLAAPLAAGTEGEEDGIVVNRLNGTDFEVVQGRTSKAGFFWCGAATFIERREGLPASTPITLLSPRGPSRTAPGLMAVVFTTDAARAPDLTELSRSLSVKRPGLTLPSHKARRYCRDAFTRSTK